MRRFALLALSPAVPLSAAVTSATQRKREFYRDGAASDACHHQYRACHVCKRAAVEDCAP